MILTARWNSEGDKFASVSYNDFMIVVDFRSEKVIYEKKAESGIFL